MIFITLGNQNFQFNRLLNAVEDCIGKGSIKEKVVLQHGHTVYTSSKMECHDFLDKEMFNSFIEKSHFIISHAGTGSIISCLNKGKKVLVGARMKEFGEHIDNHQEEILTAFSKKNLIIGLNRELSNMEEKIINLDKIKTVPFISNNSFFNQELMKIINTV